MRIRLPSLLWAINYLEMLQWAREHHCPWDQDTCQTAADYGNMELLRWAIEHGCPGGEEYEYLLT
jgi:hypothetical protein